MSDIIRFDFHGDELDCVKEGDDLWVSVRRMCEPLGLASNKQIEKLQKKSWASGTMMVSVDANRRNREQYFLHIDSVPMWLATIDEGRVAEHVRPKLVKLQIEVAQVLRDHFFGVAAKIPTSLGDALLLAGNLEKEKEAERAARMLAEVKIEEDRPRVEFADGIKGVVNSVTISEFAKSLANGGIPFGEYQLYQWLRGQRYIISGGPQRNKPFQDFIDRGYFIVDPRTRWVKRKNGNEVYYVTLITGTGQTVLEKKIRDNPDTWRELLKHKLKTGKRARAENTALV